MSQPPSPRIARTPSRYALTTRRLAWGLLLVGLALALFGAALVFNVVSLRELVEQSRIGPAIVAVFGIRDEMSDRRAHWLEVALGLSGAGLLGFAVWLLRRPKSTSA
jgi:hypothetical protein